MLFEESGGSGRFVNVTILDSDIGGSIMYCGAFYWL